MKTRQNEHETIDNDSGNHIKEESLIHIRRLDWRFLLPGTEYEHIAYLGKPDKELLDVLGHIIGKAYVLKLGELEKELKENKEKFDLIIVNDVGLKDVNFVTPLMKPGGILYWEVNRLSNFKSCWGKRKGTNKLKFMSSLLSKTSTYVRFLSQSGFHSIESYWHRPDFLTCKEIIPLYEPVALNYVFSNGTGSGLKRLKFMIGRIAMKLGLLNVLVPCFSLVAIKQNQGERT